MEHFLSISMSDYLDKAGKKVKVLVAESSLTLDDAINCSPPVSSVLGVSQAGILEWATIPFSRRSSPPRGQTQVSCVAGRLFTV